MLTEEKVRREAACSTRSTGFIPIMLLIFVNVIFLIDSQFMHPSRMKVIVAQLVFPNAIEFRINPIHPKIIMAMNTEIGQSQIRQRYGDARLYIGLM